jgi:hypothetical protein
VPHVACCQRIHDVDFRRSSTVFAAGVVDPQETLFAERDADRPMMRSPQRA